MSILTFSNGNIYKNMVFLVKYETIDKIFLESSINKTKWLCNLLRNLFITVVYSAKTKIIGPEKPVEKLQKKSWKTEIEN